MMYYPVKEWYSCLSFLFLFSLIDFFSYVNRWNEIWDEGVLVSRNKLDDDETGEP